MDKLNVLIIGFNRSDLIKQSLERLNNISFINIWIFIDGPRKKNRSDIFQNKLIKEICKDFQIKSKRKKFHSYNLGCRRGVNEAISWFFSKNEYGFILEDDIEINIDYLRYVKELLSLYKYDNRISSISSHTYLNSSKSNKKNNLLYLSPLCRVWGWGTWKRSWNNYVALKNRIKKKSVHGIFFEMPNQYKNFNSILRIWKCINGDFDTWDYEWNFFHLKSGTYSITPDRFFSLNHGFREDATHTSNEKDMPWDNVDDFTLKEFEKINSLNFPVKKIYTEICDECGFPINNNIFIEYFILLKYIIRKNFLLKN